MIEGEVEILLVEDNPNDSELALRALKKNKIANNVVVVTDGEQALDFFFARGEFSGRDASNVPKMVLLDLKLPKMDGLEVLKVLKDHDSTKTIPIIMLTSSKEENDIVESYRLGVNSYIVKPVDFDKFVEAVRDIGVYWLLLNQLPAGKR
ncbi:response regulator [Methanolobus sp.]|uniref:response regulator n=1 Tax=Methanolobus sp. TaxID=1874737 RepID=UPI0025ED8CBA|nr:response regulator [Methanolobus sp.]